jgi:beta-phosphoglucomutase family hydrolase
MRRNPQRWNTPARGAPERRRHRLRPLQCLQRLRPPALKLPKSIHACLFDLDGVLTNTASTHAEAWKQTFDAFLEVRAARDGVASTPFDPVLEYAEFVDGKQRYDGVRSFLASRGIDLPEGSPDDHAGAETVEGIGNRKNELVLTLIRDRGVQPYVGSVRFVQAVGDLGLRRAVVSASANCREVLRAAGIEDLFDARVDGIDARRDHLRGKPAPDMFEAAARIVGVRPAAAAIFEDALAGVAAGRSGGFGYVVGVDRTGHADELRAHGADVVVSDLAELLLPT